MDTGNENELFKQTFEELKSELKKKAGKKFVTRRFFPFADTLHTQDELAKVQDALQASAGRLKLVESNFDQLHQDYLEQKTAREDAAELKMQLEQEIEGSRTLFLELDEKQKESKRLKEIIEELQEDAEDSEKENKRMKQIIDEMKEDLDDARRRAVQIIPANKVSNMLDSWSLIDSLFFLKQTLDDELEKSTNEMELKVIKACYMGNSNWQVSW